MKCPKCNNLNKDDSFCCQWCGASLPRVDLTRQFTAYTGPLTTVQPRTEPVPVQPQVMPEAVQTPVNRHPSELAIKLKEGVSFLTSWTDNEGVNDDDYNRAHYEWVKWCIILAIIGFGLVALLAIINAIIA
jgi:hypothetical protein